MRIQIFIVILYIFLSSCGTLRNNSKYDLADGNYRLKQDGKKYTCYIENRNDSLLVYQLPGKGDTGLPFRITNAFPAEQHFIKPSLDIDVLTILFKVRPGAKNLLPMQLNTNFNGNIFVGHRTDIYKVHFTKNPLGTFKRQINHFGFSGGFFLGIGSTAINPSTTGNGIATEYDGLVLQKGLAGIIAINKLTIGVGLGFDNLLDRNNKSWLYENKPWVGLVLGLNLN